VLNEYGNVIGIRITPTQENIHIENMLEDIWSVKSCVDPNCVYTDNAPLHESAVYNALKTRFSKSLADLKKQVHVLQDVWHAIQRIRKTLPASHPDYYVAKAELSQIYFALRNPEAYPKKKDLEDALNNWENKWKFQKGTSTEEIVQQIRTFLSTK
jgi:hypothetical protein